MAILRPKVRISQTFASQSTTPATPDLNVLIVGPAYHVQDYTSTTKADLVIGTYGSANAACDSTGAPQGLPAAGTPAVTATTPPNNITGALLEAGSVKVFIESGLFRVGLAVDDAVAGTTITLTDNDNTLVATGATFVTWGVLPGDRLVITDGAGVTIEKTVLSVVDETTLTMTSNFTSSGTDIDGNSYSSFNTTGSALRVERSLEDGTELDASFITVSGQQTDIDGGVTVVSGTATPLLHSATLYMSYRALRQDLAEVKEVTSTNLTSVLGEVDERNPLAVGAFVALQNTSTPVQVYGILSDNLDGANDRLAGYTSARDAIASRSDIYAIVPLANESSIIGLFKDHAVAMSDPEVSKFRIALGSGVLATSKIVSPQANGSTEEDAADPVDVFVDTAHTNSATGFVTGGVKAGDTLVVSSDTTAFDANVVFSSTIRRVINEDILQTDLAIGISLTSHAYKITRGTSTVIDESGSLRAFTTRRSLRVLLDNTATFLTSGVIAGDYVEVPGAGQVDFSGATDKYVIEAVISENRVRIAGTEGELPADASGGPSATELYRVGRNLDKDGQVTELSAITQAYNESRLTMVWPGSVLVSGVTDASTGLQSKQPGYYLAAAVGGMIAGNPPHQNFSSLSINGFDQVFNSSGYFSDDQIDALSAAGWYVVLQDSAAAPPYSVHSVTTDPATLESSELMIVKNFDYVSLFYKGVITPFLKGYNITPDTLNLIQDAFDSATAALKGQVRPKLGAPILTGKLESIEVLQTSADHVQMVGSVTLPRMLNQMTLILVG